MRVLSIDDEFREDTVLSAIQEKFREGVAQRGSYDELRRSNAGANGSQPGTERGPHQRGHVGGQILKQPLGDNAGVNKNMVGVDLALYRIAVV